jgi:hypothetical protein
MPRFALSGSFTVLLLVFTGQIAFAQDSASLQAPVRDPQGIAILTQSANAAGGTSAILAVQDYSASGEVNYYWGDGEQGTVVVKGRGTGQFRAEATLPEGVRSWAVSNGTGWVKEADGRTDVIFSHNAGNLGSLTFPFAYLVSALQDTSTSVIYVGLETINGAQAHHIRAQKNYPQGSDPTGLFQKLSKREFFVDASSLLVVASEDMTHPRDTATVDAVRRVQFSDYRRVNGVLLPFRIAESVAGQRGETFQLSQMAFNTGLQDSDFAQ